MIEKNDHDLIVEIHSVLLGINGQGGLCRSHATLYKIVLSHSRQLYVIKVLGGAISAVLLILIGTIINKMLNG